MNTNPTRLGELTAYDLGSTITFHDGGATYTGTLISVKHEFPDGKRRTFLMLVSSSGKWRHADRYPSNLPIDEIVRPALATGGTIRGEHGPEKFVPRGPGGGAGGSVVMHVTSAPVLSADALAIRGELIRRGELEGRNRA